GLSSYVVGDILYASGTTTFASLADVATGQVLTSGGVGVAPAYTASPSLTSLTLSTSLLGSPASTLGATTTTTCYVGTTSNFASAIFAAPQMLVAQGGNTPIIVGAWANTPQVQFWRGAGTQGSPTA